MAKRNRITSDFFKKMNTELDEIKKEYDALKSYITEDNYDYYNTCNPDWFDENIEKFKIWKIELLLSLNNSYKTKVKNMTLEIEKEFLILKTILRDMYWKYNTKKSKTKENLEIEKLLKAREENIDFEVDLVELINPIYGDSYIPVTIEKIFNDLGYRYTSYHSTRPDDINNLERLNIQEVHNFISNGLFKKKYYKNYCKKHGGDYKMLIKDIAQDVKDFIKDSLSASESLDLSTVLDMNINMELLFQYQANTQDKELNELIEEAKNRFISNDKQVAIEKLWDAFERLKTYFDNGKKKKQSADKVLEIISDSFDKDFLENEFKNLTKVGNNYRIRHHETDKSELQNEHINYFFFRMLSLIDLCLMYLNEEENVDK